MDPRLIGRWNNSGGTTASLEINAAGEFFALNPDQAYTLTASDTVLTFPGTNPLQVFSRLSGSTGIIGLWERYETDSDGEWREEWTYRADGTFTYHWSLDDSFDSEGMGTYSDSGTSLTSAERRLNVTTDTATGSIVFAVYFGALITGTYTVAADSNSWEMTTPSGTTIYNRAP